MTITTFSGFLIGLLFGFVLERGYFCHFSGFVDATVFKNYRILKATLWTLLFTTVGFHAAAAAGIIQLNPKPLLIVANLAGGVIFGFGMFLVGACMAGTTFKIGAGTIAYFLAAIGIGAGAFFTREGFLKPYYKNIQEMMKIEIAKKSPTLDNVLGANPWIIVIILSIIFIFLLILLKEKNIGSRAEKISIWNKIFVNRWSPLFIGISIAITQILAFYASTKAGKKYAISLTEGYSLIPKSLVHWDFSNSIVTWGYLLVLGIIAGAVIASLLAGEFKIKMPKTKHLIIMPIGGILMGIGAGVGGGCNVGHLLSGLPQLSIGSIINSIAIFATLYILVYFKFIKNKN